MSAARIRLDDFTIYEGARDTVWEQNVEIWSPSSADRRHRDDRTVAVVVELDVDGQFDRVSAELGQYGEITSIDRVIDALTKVRDTLAAIPGASRTGRCFATGQYSGCWHEHGHDGAHKFDVPTDGRHLTVAERREYATTPWEGSPVDAPLEDAS